MESSQAHARLRLAETIAWCSAQGLENSPVESEEITQRRGFHKEAGQLYVTLYRLESNRWLRWFTNRKRERIQNEVSQLRQRAGDITPPLKDQLRTASLKPSASFHSVHLEEERAILVETVCEKRVALLNAGRDLADANGVDLAGGRILLYAPDENLCCGAAEYESMGFFDVDNVPPWDTWVCFAGKHLISWVPRILLGLASVGVNVNPEACIEWADDSFVKRLFG